MSARPLRKLERSPLRRHSGPGAIVVSPCESLQTASSGTSSEQDRNISDEPGDCMAYQLADITLCQVPKGRQ